VGDPRRWAERRPAAGGEGPPSSDGDGGLVREVSSVADGDRFLASDRRWLLLLLVLLLVILGVGVGGLPGGQDRQPSPTPAVSMSTPTPTPTPIGSGTGGSDGSTGDDRGTTPTDETETPTESGPTTTPEGPDDEEPTTSTPRTGDGGSGGSGSGGGDGTGSAVALQTAGSSARIQYANVAPGEGGRERFVVENVGNGSGRLSMTEVAVRDVENGVGESEAVVDDSPHTGELSSHVLVVLEVHHSDGSVHSLYGTGSGARSLASLGAVNGADDAGVLGPGERAELVVDWRVPASTGNEIQSDGVTFDLTVGLASTAS